MSSVHTVNYSASELPDNNSILLIPPREIRIPLGDNYGGIERIVEDLYNHMKRCNVKVSLLDWDKEFTDTDGFMTLDFSHLKDLSIFFPSTSYIAYTFATDRISWKHDVFATKVVKDWFRKVNLLTGGNDVYLSSCPVVYPGIQDIYSYNEQKEEYALFLGRIAPYKGVLEAIEAAKMMNLPIKVAGHTGMFAGSNEYINKVKDACENYSRGEFIGDVTTKQKVDLLSHARCLIAPSDWSMLPGAPPESFGIVAVEALLSGTPVIGPTDSGIEEIVTKGKTLSQSRAGELVSKGKTSEETIKKYAYAMKIIDIITDAKSCREVGSYFTVERFWNDLKQLIGVSR